MILRTLASDIESWLRMELFLNLAWVLLVALLFWAWRRHAMRSDGNRSAQLISLVLLVLTLFPVISVSDDLQALQNPAEVDCCLRRDHTIATAHSIIPAVVAMPQPVFAEIPFGFVRFATPGRLPLHRLSNPAAAPIENRPPPAA